MIQRQDEEDERSKTKNGVVTCQTLAVLQMHKTVSNPKTIAVQPFGPFPLQNLKPIASWAHTPFFFLFVLFLFYLGQSPFISFFHFFFLQTKNLFIFF